MRRILIVLDNPVGFIFDQHAQVLRGGLATLVVVFVHCPEDFFWWYQQNARPQNRKIILTVGFFTNVFLARIKMQRNIMHKRPLLVGNAEITGGLSIHRVLVFSWRGVIQMVLVVFPWLFQLFFEIIPLVHASFQLKRLFLVPAVADITRRGIRALERLGLGELRNVGGDVLVVEQSSRSIASGRVPDSSRAVHRELIGVNAQSVTVGFAVGKKARLKDCCSPISIVTYDRIMKETL